MKWIKTIAIEVVMQIILVTIIKTFVTYCGGDLASINSLWFIGAVLGYRIIARPIDAYQLKLNKEIGEDLDNL